LTDGSRTGGECPPPNGAPPSKICRECVEFKPISKFHRRKGGYQPICKECANRRAAAYRAAYRARAGKPPARKRCPGCGLDLPSSAFWRARSAADGLHSRCTDCERPKGARRYQENKDEMHRKNMEWRRANPERTREIERRAKRRYSRKRYAEDPEYRRAHSERNAARRLRGREVGSFSPGEWTAMLDFYERCCLCCGADGVTVDHVVPLSKGGSNALENIQPLCRSCNCRKGTKTADYRDPWLHGQFLEALTAELLAAA